MILELKGLNKPPKRNALGDTELGKDELKE